MSEEKAPEAGAIAAAAPGPSKLPLLMGLVNTVLILSAMGLLYFTKMVFKRPAITENAERSRLAAIHATSTPPTAPMMVLFDPITVNIEAVPGKPLPDDGTPRQIQGKMHYCSFGFSLEIRDSRRQTEIEELRPILIDKILNILGHKKFQELNSVQGRYLLKTDIMNFANDYLNNHQIKKELPKTIKAGEEGLEPEKKDILITDLYFNEFIVQ